MHKMSIAIYPVRGYMKGLYVCRIGNKTIVGRSHLEVIRKALLLHYVQG